MTTSSKPSSKLYLGLMSGTSLDGIDAVLVDFSDKQPNLITSHTHPIPIELRQEIIHVIQPEWTGSLSDIGQLHQKLGELFAKASKSLLHKASLDSKSIQAIGSHGQTVWHEPNGAHPFSMQLGDANIIAEKTNIKTVADFRGRDIAAGGQGAPLVPAFHQELFRHSEKNRAILNIGGIANLTILPSLDTNTSAIGFDTGPGNGLIDAWISQHGDKHYDKNGDWGRSGDILSHTLETLLSHEYFSSKPPKSTGKEAFNLAWLNKILGERLINEKPQDIQATLTELTALTIASNINTHNDDDYFIGKKQTSPISCDELFICGGGIHNSFLLERLQYHLPSISIESTEKLGVNPDWMEAIAFAWLAKQTMEGASSNLPSVTGAEGKRILGAIYSS